MKFRLGTLLTVFVTLLFGYALFEARDFPTQAQIYAVTVAGTGFIFGIITLVIELRAKTTWVGQEGLLDLAPDRSTPPAVVYMRALRVLGWILGLYLCIWILGFKIAIFLFFLLFLKLEGRAGWLLTGILTAIAAYLMVFQFEQRLSIFWPEGLIERYFELPGFL